MLVQSRNGELLVLPVLPQQWESGEVNGLCVRGGAQVSIKWTHGMLGIFTVKPSHDFTALIVYKDRERQQVFRAANIYTFDCNLKII